MKPLLPGTSGADGRPIALGVMGGGQLGRMFVQAAQSMGFATVVLEPDAASPAGVIAHEHIVAPYTDARGLARLAQASAAITTEFENVPASALAALGAERPVSPSAECVAVCQDRAAEKRHFGKSGVPCAPFALIESKSEGESEADLARIDDALLPGILKTARLGYDGKGQVRVADRAALLAAWRELAQVPCVLEALLPLRRELSVIVARTADGTMVQLPVQQNLHRDGILAVTQVPPPDIDDETQARAVDCARRLADRMQYVGVLCVEFFILNDGSLVANEMAPRPHNSGHWSLDACNVSQFELQVRCLAGLPLPTVRQHSGAVMLNLLGDLWFDAEGRERTPPWAAVLELPFTHLHLYGKASARRGRKMGHLTVAAPDAGAARSVALQACALLGLDPF